jgi:phosphoribosylanthranilate isomerase
LKDQNEEKAEINLPKKYHWDIAFKAKDYGRIILSGGLNPNNIEDAIRFLNPYGVDVCSGVELSPGKLDKSLLRIFISKARDISLYYAEDKAYE